MTLEILKHAWAGKIQNMLFKIQSHNKKLYMRAYKEAYMCYPRKMREEDWLDWNNVNQEISSE
jgi:hypothetical protein